MVKRDALVTTVRKMMICSEEQGRPAMITLWKTLAKCSLNTTVMSVVGVALAAALTAACQPSEGIRSDPSEVGRTWSAAKIWLPKPYGGSNPSPAWWIQSKSRLYGRFDPPDAKLPVILYLHGCTGIERDERADGYYLTRAGYVVIMPDSYARTNRPSNCNPKTKAGDLFRGVFRFRFEEVDYALEQIKQLSWVDHNNVFLMGFSEGGVTTAAYPRGDFTARVILGWTCHAGNWYEIRGVRAPEDEPVLAIVSRRDPWYQNPWNRGHCGDYLHGRKGSKSILLDGSLHHVTADAEVREAVLQFLKLNSR